MKQYPGVYVSATLNYGALLASFSTLLPHIEHYRSSTTDCCRPHPPPYNAVQCLMVCHSVHKNKDRPGIK